MSCMQLLGAFSRKMTGIQPDVTNRACSLSKAVIPTRHYRGRFSSLETKTEGSMYWGGEDKGRERAARDTEYFPRLQAPLILQSISQGQRFCFTACRKAAVCKKSTEQTSYLNSNHVYFMFPEHLERRIRMNNQNEHQNIRYYCKTHSKMLSKRMVNKILPSWLESF